jgi:putative flippase GtrA
MPGEPVKTRQRKQRGVTSPGTLGCVPPTPASGLRVKLRALVRELGKFGTVGLLSFTLDTVIFNVMLGLGAGAIGAKLISTVISTTFAFCGNRFWTWRHRTHTHMARQYTLFFAFNAIGLGIGLGCLGISHYWLGSIWPVLQSRLADNISAQIVGTAFGTLFRFWSYRRFVFPDTSEELADTGGLQTEPPATTVTSPSSPS